jgi:hypothetical protein
MARANQDIPHQIFPGQPKERKSAVAAKRLTEILMPFSTTVTEALV